jgi:phosphoglycolate phosphatase
VAERRVNGSPPRAVVFDLDGTLVDSREDIVRSTQHTLQVHGAEVLSGDVIATFVGDGARALLAGAFRLPATHPSLDGYLETFLDYYTAHAADYTRPMPGAIEAMGALSSYPFALATNKMRRTTDAVLEKLGLRDRFRVIVGGGDLPKHKPDPMVLTHVARELGVEPTSLVMVGDGHQDVLAGVAVGARTVGVLGGFGTESALREAGADVVIASLAELPRAIRQMAS